MARYARSIIMHDNCYFHITWQCHNHDFLFKNDIVKDMYYNLLLKYKDKYELSIYSYCIMSNHFHMVGHAAEQQKVSDFMRIVNSLFAKQVNKYLKRRGQVCMDRFKSPIINTDQDMLNVMVYLDLNPIRASIVQNPIEYKYSSYKYYAFGDYDPLVSISPSYESLGATEIERQSNYRVLIDTFLGDPLKRKKRENYSKILYIGDPDWVVFQYKKIREYHNSSYKKYCAETFISS